MTRYKKVCFDLSKPQETLMFLSIAMTGGLITTIFYELVLEPYITALKNGGTSNNPTA